MTGAAEPSALVALESFAATVDESERFPAALLGSADLEQAGVPRGPLWGSLLLEAEESRLDLLFTDREGALAWLAGRAAALDSEL